MRPIKAKLHRMITNNAYMEEWQDCIDRRIEWYERGGCQIIGVQIIVKEPKSMHGYFLLITYYPPEGEED